MQETDLNKKTQKMKSKGMEKYFEKKKESSALSNRKDLVMIPKMQYQ